MHYSSEQNVSKTLILLARLRLVKYGRFWLLSGRREVAAEIRELPENTGDLATLYRLHFRQYSALRKIRQRVVLLSSSRRPAASVAAVSHVLD